MAAMPNPDRFTLYPDDVIWNTAEEDSKQAMLMLRLKHLPGGHNQMLHGRRNARPGGFAASRPPSAEEKAAVKAYMTTRYREINGPLRDGKALADQDQESVHHLDALMRRSATEQEMTLWRGTSEIQSWKTPDVWPPENAIGTVIEDRGFVSTSPEERVAKNFGADVLFKITVPKGSRGLDLRDRDFGLNEAEFLLSRGSRFRITDESPAPGGKRLIELELIDG